MRKNIVERRSCGIRYFVDVTTPSDIYIEKEFLEQFNDSKFDISVTGISKYLRECVSDYSPILLSWDMTSRCNFSCPFCYIRDNSISKEVSYEETVTVLDGLISEGLFEVYLSGGECLLLEDFLKIYKHLKKKGVFVTVFTNASLLNDEIINCWKVLPPASVEITLYNDDFSSLPYLNLIRLRELGIHVQPKYTLTKTTVRYYERVQTWMKQNGFYLAVDTELFDGVDELHANIESNYALSIEDRIRYSPQRYEYSEKTKAVRKGFPCSSKKGIIQIAPDFTISLCNKMKTRWDLRTVDINDAVDSLRKLIRKYEDCEIRGCSGCVFSKKCSMCYANAEMINGELYVPEGFCGRLEKKWREIGDMM